MSPSFPLNQRELIRLARGDRTQAEFADVIGVSQTTLSRYESEKLGAPPAVINSCLVRAAELLGHIEQSAPLAKALQCTREAVAELERLTGRPSAESGSQAESPR